MRTLIDCVRVLFENDRSASSDVLHEVTLRGKVDTYTDVDLLRYFAEQIYATLQNVVARELPLVEAMAELITAQQANVEPDFARVLKQHTMFYGAQAAQPQDVFAQLEKKWLEKHPRRWNALTPQSQQLLETMVDALLEETTAVEAEKTLVVLRDVYNTFTRGEKTRL